MIRVRYVVVAAVLGAALGLSTRLFFVSHILVLMLAVSLAFSAASPPASNRLRSAIVGAMEGSILAICAIASLLFWDRVPAILGAIVITSACGALGAVGNLIRRTLGGRGTAFAAVVAVAAAIAYWQFFSYAGDCRRHTDCPGATWCVEATGFGIPMWRRWMVCDRPCGVGRPPCPAEMSCANLVDATIDGSVFACRT